MAIDQERYRSISPQEKARLHRRTLVVIALSQVFGGAGLAAGVTVGALLAQDMLGTEAYAGVPSALFTLGAATAALLVGRLSARYGRRVGLVAGLLGGTAGAIGVVFAASSRNVPLLLVSLLVYGAGTATNLQARYAGTDLAEPSGRAKAVAVALVCTTFGAVAGPNLVEPMGDVAQSLELPRLVGPFLLSGTAYLLAALVLWTLLRPDPLVVSKALERAAEAVNPSAEPSIRATRGIVVGATTMVLTQIAMVAIMTMTPVHMQHHGHGLSDIGLVISVHVAAMFLPSLLTGVLVDRFGRVPMAIAAAATLLAAGVTAALAPPDSMGVLLVALGLLGLGWNFGLISGTALIVDATTPTNRARTQGSVDLLISLAGATGGVMSGLVVAGAGYAELSLGGGVLALLLIPVVVWFRRAA